MDPWSKERVEEVMKTEKKHTLGEFLDIAEKAFDSQSKVAGKLIGAESTKVLEEVKVGVAQGLMSSQDVIDEANALIDQARRR